MFRNTLTLSTIARLRSLSLGIALTKVVDEQLLLRGRRVPGDARDNCMEMIVLIPRPGLRSRHHVLATGPLFLAGNGVFGCLHFGGNLETMNTLSPLAT